MSVSACQHPNKIISQAFIVNDDVPLLGEVAIASVLFSPNG